jgi:hypothetical protein
MFTRLIISIVVELLHQIVVLLQKIKLIFKSFQVKNMKSIFDSTKYQVTPNHKILLTIKIYKSWQQIQEES